MTSATRSGQERSNVNYFHVGDCLQDPLSIQGGGQSVVLVDCAQPHSAEVYAVFVLPDGPFPGNDSSGYKKQCVGVARTLPNAEAMNNDPTLRTTVTFPDQRSWAAGDRSLTCLASFDSPRTGSILATT